MHVAFVSLDSGAALLSAAATTLADARIADPATKTATTFETRATSPSSLRVTTVQGRQRRLWPCRANAVEAAYLGDDARHSSLLDPKLGRLRARRARSNQTSAYARRALSPFACSSFACFANPSPKRPGYPSSQGCPAAVRRCTRSPCRRCRCTPGPSSSRRNGTGRWRIRSTDSS